MRLSLGSAQRPAARHRLAGAAAACLCATVAAAAPLTGAAPASAAPAGRSPDGRAGPDGHARRSRQRTPCRGQPIQRRRVTGGTGSGRVRRNRLWRFRVEQFQVAAVPGPSSSRSGGSSGSGSSGSAGSASARGGGIGPWPARPARPGARPCPQVGPLSGPRRAAAAQGEGLRLRRRRRGHRPGAGRQGPARPVPARQHAEGPDRHRLDAGAQPGRDRGRLAPGREPDTEQGRADPGRQLHRSPPCSRRC